MQTQTDIIFQVATDWQSEFRLYLEQDYRKVSPVHRNPSEKSVKAACQHVRVFSMWWEAKYQEALAPEKLTNFDLHAYRHHSLEEARVKPDTWNSRLWALRIFCDWVHATHGGSYANLADGIEVKKQGNQASPYRSLTDQEYGYLVHKLERRTRDLTLPLQHQNAVRDQAMISMMLFAGLRVEEVSLLDASDITVNERSGSVRVRNGKGSKERMVPLNLSARNGLKHWMSIHAYGSLFIGKNTGRLSTRHIERIVSALGAECRIPGLSPHWLRYTFAKRCEKSGMSIESIRDLLGHESIETTRRYLRSSFDDLQSAVEGL